eukprot:scaffold8798_cov117-Cylindrotheca_fusiformis.AAC.1
MGDQSGQLSSSYYPPCPLLQTLQQIASSRSYQALSVLSLSNDYLPTSDKHFPTTSLFLEISRLASDGDDGFAL